MLSLIRKYLIAGLLIWIPLLVTIFVINFIVSLLDKSLALLPKSLQPINILGWHIPGLGVVLSLVILFFTGMFMTNFLGKKLFSIWNRFINRIPVIRSIYMGVKQIMETIFSPSGKAFKNVLLVQYPRKGMWSIAFQTGDTSKEVTKYVNQDMITIFIPTTPNPTSGFLMMVPHEEVTFLDMSVDQALKMVISLGVVQPTPKPLLDED
jgi:uncharacterized membrane protein